MTYAIRISLTQRRLFLLQNGKIINSWPVGIGKDGTPTPPGQYHIINKRPNPGGPFGAMWMGLSQPSYGIHGTNNSASIGGMVSKGCIRMHNKDVLNLARIVPIGTPVTISYR